MEIHLLLHRLPAFGKTFSPISSPVVAMVQLTLLDWSDAHCHGYTKALAEAESFCIDTIQGTCIRRAQFRDDSLWSKKRFISAAIL